MSVCPRVCVRARVHIYRESLSGFFECAVAVCGLGETVGGEVAVGEALSSLCGSLPLPGAVPLLAESGLKTLPPPALLTSLMLCSIQIIENIM